METQVVMEEMVFLLLLLGQKLIMLAEALEVEVFLLEVILQLLH